MLWGWMDEECWRGETIPFAQSAVVHDELDVLDGTDLLEFSSEIIFADVEEEIPHVDGWAGRRN